MEKLKFSVLMSIYIKEKPEYARACFESLIKQTVPADEWVIIEDGPLTDELYNLLNEYEEKLSGLIKRIPLPENQGLGKALRIGITHCTYDLVARMDTDDICREDRFEKQLDLFKKNKDLDICGSHIIEFENTICNEISRRIVPLGDSEIRKYQKRRDAFNHMTVMYKKEAVINAGNYQHALLMEDTLLWVNMLKNGAKAANIDDFLVYSRVGKDLYDRRGGYSYFKKYKSGRRTIYNTGYISKWDYIYTLIIQFIVSMLPNNIRAWIFSNLLHRNNKHFK